jgi:hypothetical protein
VEKAKAILTSRITWAFFGVLAGQFAPKALPYIQTMGAVFGS